MARSELFHIGIVVPDVATAARRFTDLLGIEWGPVLEQESSSFRRPSGEDVVLSDFVVRYSVSSPHLELIQEQPGSPWVCNQYSNLHHIGFFSDAVVPSSEKLTALRCPLEVSGHDPESDATTWWYHRDPLGVRIEFIDAQIMPRMSEMMFECGGTLDAPVVVPGI